MTAPISHPEPVKAAMRAAVRDGLTAAEIGRQMRAGTLLGLEAPYEMPQSTVEYYARKTRKEDQALKVTELAAGDPSKAVDHLARQLLSEAELGIKEARRAAERDPETLKKYADLLKVVGPLLRSPDDKPRRRKRTDKPADPLTARLTTPADTPTQRQQTSNSSHDQPINHDQTTTTPDHNGTDHGRVVVQAPVSGPWSATDQGEGAPGRQSGAEQGFAPPFAPHPDDQGR